MGQQPQPPKRGIVKECIDMDEDSNANSKHQSLKKGPRRPRWDMLLWSDAAEISWYFFQHVALPIKYQLAILLHESHCTYEHPETVQQQHQMLIKSNPFADLRISWCIPMESLLEVQMAPTVPFCRRGAVPKPLPFARVCSPCNQNSRSSPPPHPRGNAEW